MNLLDFNFSEFLGLFLGFSIMAYLIVVFFTGIMNLFSSLWGDKINRVFHYHYHYRDKR